jgi:hypothetical protein
MQIIPRMEGALITASLWEAVFDLATKWLCPPRMPFRKEPRRIVGIHASENMFGKTAIR